MTLPSEELRKYLDAISDAEDRDNIHEMANVGPKRHGIDNVYIFVGSVVGTPHWLIVKVSNTPGKYDWTNNFVIRMPSLDYDPRQVADWITTKIMNKILSWIKINQKLLLDYEIGEITDTDEFLVRISKI